MKQMNNQWFDFVILQVVSGLCQPRILQKDSKRVLFLQFSTNGGGQHNDRLYKRPPTQVQSDAKDMVKLTRPESTTPDSTTIMATGQLQVLPHN